MSQICDYELSDLIDDNIQVIIYIRTYGDNEILINKYQYNINIILPEAVLRDTAQYIIQFYK